MTSRERMLCAYRGGMPDRAPVYIRGVYPLIPGWMETKDPSFRRLAEYVAQKADMQHTWSPPQGVFGDQPSSTRLVGTEGDWEIHETVVETPKGPLTSRTRVSTVGHPSLRAKDYVENERDLERYLSIPYTPETQDASEFFEMDRALGDAGVTMALFRCAAYDVWELMGSELLAIWSVTNRSRILELLEMFHERTYNRLKTLLEAGVGPVIGLIGEELATPPLLSPRDFAEFVGQYDKQLIDLAHQHDCIVRIHCHGNLKEVLDTFLDMGVDALHPVETVPLGDITLEEFRARVGNRIVVKGNIQVGDLCACSKEEIEALCRETIRVAGKDGALILAPTASPYQPVLTDQVFENYKAMMDTARRVGRY